MEDRGAILRMPPNFVWGAATAAHQNEGGNDNNQWAAWEQQPGRILAGQTCGRATDWWNLSTAEADFDRAAGLGLNSLRMSLEWSRIEPEENVFDTAALRHYRRMIGLLQERCLEPLVTLHHFTDPAWLAGRGGWENPRVIEYFARFVTKVVDALGDQVNFWCTINEPMVYAYSGYLEGYFPPGARSLRRMLGVLRQMLLAHGRAYRIIHALQNGARVGLAHNMRVLLPADPTNVADQRAVAVLDQIGNLTTLEATLHGRLIPPVGWGQTVSQLLDTSDYIGLNYYTTERAAFDPSRPAELFTRRFYDGGGELSEQTAAGYPYGEINPGGLYLALKRLAAYGKPIYVTENGVPDRDDRVRPRFIATHLAEAWRAIREGVDLRGYYHWTLVDNFEWCEGWQLRFGLFDVDLATGARSPKTSAAVYGRIAQANGVPREVMERVAPLEVVRYFPDGRGA
jgi:beta-glucosidase